MVELDFVSFDNFVLLRNVLELDFGKINNFVLLHNKVEMDFGRLYKFVLLRNMVELDFGRLDNLNYFLTWQNWIMVDWTISYYFVTW